MAPHKPMRAKTWSLERTTFPLKIGKNGQGAKSRSQMQGPYEPRTKAIWKVESTKDIVYGLLDFSSLSTLLYTIVLWAQAPNLPLAHVPICMHY